MIDAKFIAGLDKDQLLAAVVSYPFLVPLSSQFVVRMRLPFEPYLRPVVLDVRRLPARAA